ncbi:serine/threonine-protein kinase Nek5-like isoform X3 [Folsomia candida]|uniref:serine/threonine-protein kinase Nek5-like isoform X3 n=1 Tax=Folsomia candida TaxID=158441 RepID=UPI0016055E45|nr:serine/threonine-protein kinase Nek5-like isoform X3 [Folsomia candida]
MASKNFKKKSTPSKNKGYVSRIYSEYELMWELGRGSFGIVWAAKRRGTSPKDPPYALKRTFPVDDTQGFDDLRLMEKELEALSQLRQYQHPNVVEINTAVIEKPPEGWVEENDPLFKEFMKGVPEAELLDSCNGFGGAGTICPVTIVQRYCPGGTLEDWLRTTCLADRDADLLLNFATQLADGLRFLHYKNIIHRDLKPGNIFLKKLDEFPGHEDTTLIRLGDLGMSKFVQRTDREMDTRGTRLDNLNLRDDVTNASAGTPLYLSPEQEAGLSYGFSVDVYALGLILAELFLPCPAKPILLELKDYAAKKTSTFNPTLILFPVMELILKMMSTSPQERPSASTVHSVLLAIWRGMLTLPVHYYPTTLNTTSRLPSPSPARESDIWLERPELDDLLKSYQDSRERIFFLSGPAGSGKSTIGLQFAQKVTLTDGGTSIIWITLNEGWVVKNELEVVGRQLRANIYRDSGHRVAVSEFIYLINDAFRDQKWIFILDNFNSGNPLEHAVLLELIRIQQDITVTNKPFVLIVTRKQYLYQTILSERLHYITEREFGPIFTGSRLDDTLIRIFLRRALPDYFKNLGVISTLPLIS